MPLVLSACFGMKSGPKPIASPPDFPVTEDVIRALKADLAEYLVYQQSVDNQPALNNACQGQLNFKVSSIDVKLTTTSEFGTNGSLGSKVPVAGFELGPKLAGSRTDKSSQDLSFSIEIRPNDKFSGTVTTPRPGTFYAALRSTREAMLAASDVRPCLTFTAKQDNSITAAFEAKKERETGIGVSFLIFSVEAGAKQGVTTGNSVTVNFAGEGGFLVDDGGRKVKGRGRGWLTGKLPIEFRILDTKDAEAEVAPVPTDKPPKPR